MAVNLSIPSTWSPSQWAPAGEQVKRAAPLIALAVIGYAVALIATLPAEVAVKAKGAAPGLHDASGTVWKGAASLGEGMTMRWRLAPLRSIFSLSVVNDIELKAADTSLTGRAQIRPGRLVLRDIKGRAGWAAVKAVTPALPFSCALTAFVDLHRIEVGKRASTMSGRILTEPGACRSTFDNQPTPVPPLVFETLGSGPSARASLAEQGRRSRPLAELVLTPDHKIRFSTLPAGSTLLPSILTAGAAFETGL